MDFLDPKKKRAHNIRLLIGYSLMAVLLLITTTLVVFATYGYDINPRTGEIMQNGLVFVDSHPVSAQVLVNGEDKGNTGQRLVMQAGNYAIQLKREGYVSWEHNLELGGGKIERLVYPLLFPVTIKKTDVATLPTPPSFVTTSPDKKHLVIGLATDGGRTIQVYDQTQKTLLPRLVTLPSTILPGESFTGVKPINWDQSQRFVLCEVTVASGKKFVVVDTLDGTRSVDISALTGLSPSSVTFKNNNFDEYYLHMQGERSLYFVAASSPTPTLVAGNVLAFAAEGNNHIAYVSLREDTTKVVDLKLLDNGRADTVRTLDAGDQYWVHLATYDGSLVLAGGSSANGKMYVYRDIINGIHEQRAGKALAASSVLRLDGASAFSAAPNKRFLLLQSESKSVIFDIELSRTHRFSLASPSGGTTSQWMDEFRLLIQDQATKKLQSVDFDGTNKVSLADATSFPVSFDPKYERMFTIEPVGTNFVLRSSSLLAE